MRLKSFIKRLFLFFAGGFIYYAMEMMFRGRSHWTMGIVGGICFLICGELNEIFTFNMSLLKQGVICSGLITSVEFVAGVILNLWLKLDIWDYSNIPFNLFGQICLPFTLLWVLVGIMAVIMDDYLRCWFFGEDKPHYTIVSGYPENCTKCRYYHTCKNAYYGSTACKFKKQIQKEAVNRNR